MKNLFLIIGAPGSGKTTDAKTIADRNSDSIAHYSAGDLLRKEMLKEGERGRLIESYISKGELVPLHIVVSIVVDSIKSESRQTILIDGYPRSVDQMLELDKVLQGGCDISLISVIEVVVSRETAENRVLGRSRGNDDTKEIFENRMRLYESSLPSILDFYGKRDLLYKIDGERSVGEITDEMQAFIESVI